MCFGPLVIWLLMGLVSWLIRDAGDATMRRSPQDDPACAACRYPLTGLPVAALCPECGSDARLTSEKPRVLDQRAGRWIVPWAAAASLLAAAPGAMLWFINDIHPFSPDALIMLAMLVIHALVVVFSLMQTAQRIPRATRQLPPDAGKRLPPKRDRWVAIASLTLLTGGQAALGLWVLIGDMQRVPMPGAHPAEHRLGIVSTPVAVAMFASTAYIALGLTAAATWNSLARSRARRERS